MGALLAGHVRDAGHDVTVWNRHRRELDGARVADTVGDAVTGAQVVVTMLFDPDSVRAVADDLVEHAAEGAVWVDVTTVGPAASRELAQRAGSAGVRFVDAPVLGSTPLAEPGELTTVVGGADEDVERVRPLLQTWCADGKVVHVGPVGSGSAMKLVVNQSLGAVAAGLGEALGLADHLGLPQGRVLDVLSAGAYGWTLGQKRPMLESGDFSDATFSLAGLAKDLGLVVDAAGDHPVPLTREVRARTQDAVDEGHGDEDYAVVIARIAAGRD